MAPSLEEMRKMFEAGIVREREAKEAEAAQAVEQQKKEARDSFQSQAKRPNLGLGFAYWLRVLRSPSTTKADHSPGVTTYVIESVFEEYVVVHPLVEATTETTGWSILNHVVVLKKAERTPLMSKDAGRWSFSSKATIDTYAEAVREANRLTDERLRSTNFHGTKEYLVDESAAPTPPYCETCKCTGWLHTSTGAANVGLRIVACQCARFQSETDAKIVHDSKRTCRECFGQEEVKG